MNHGKRVIIDCRDFPNEIGCTLLISGSSKEVSKVALRHAIEEHGHKDTQELHRQIKAMMKNDSKYQKKQTKNKKTNK